MAGDIFFLIPMIEMCGFEHSKYVTDANYIYNVETTLNEFKTDLPKSQMYADMGRAKKPYVRIR